MDLAASQANVKAQADPVDARVEHVQPFLDPCSQQLAALKDKLKFDFHLCASHRSCTHLRDLTPALSMSKWTPHTAMLFKKSLSMQHAQARSTAVAMGPMSCIVPIRDTVVGSVAQTNNFSWFIQPRTQLYHFRPFWLKHYVASGLILNADGKGTALRSGWWYEPCGGTLNLLWSPTSVSSTAGK